MGGADIGFMHSKVERSCMHGCNKFTWSKLMRAISFLYDSLVC